MANPQAQPVKFDLAKGSVRAGLEERVVLVPVLALDELSKHAGVEAARQFARLIGVAVGRRLAARLGSIDGVRGASVEEFATELGVELALGGWGALTLERWGRALVLVVEHSPMNGHALIAGLLEGAVEGASGREVHAAALNSDGAARVLITSRRGAERARVWVAEGVSSNEVLSRLQEGEGS